MTRDEAAVVKQGLLEFADRFTGPRNCRDIGVVLRDPTGDVGGGITAYTVWDWLQIENLWVAEALRGRGYGWQLLSRAEAIAVGYGCRLARLDTFEFEAREFYERRGYVVYAQTDNFPEGHTQFHLRKEL
jgi:GNAT superfamily N-acetyltransferase